MQTRPREFAAHSTASLYVSKAKNHLMLRSASPARKRSHAPIPMTTSVQPDRAFIRVLTGLARAEINTWKRTWSFSDLVTPGMAVLICCGSADASGFHRDASPSRGPIRTTGPRCANSFVCGSWPGAFAFDRAVPVVLARCRYDLRLGCRSEKDRGSPPHGIIPRPNPRRCFRPSARHAIRLPRFARFPRQISAALPPRCCRRSAQDRG